MRKMLLNGFKRAMVIASKWADLNISKPTDLLRFSRIFISKVYIEWIEKVFSKMQVSEWKLLVGERSRKEIAKIKLVDR